MHDFRRLFFEIVERFLGRMHWKAATFSIGLVSLIIAISFFANEDANGCEFCGLYNNSLTMDIESSQIAIVGHVNQQGIFEITEEIKGVELISNREELQIDIVETMVVCLVVGSLSEDDGEVNWTKHFPLKPFTYQYLNQALNAPEDQVKRLSLFWPYLNSRDPYVADDAYRQFAMSDYKTLQAFREKMDRKRVTEFITDERLSPPALRDLGFMLLSVCGTPEDARYPYEVLSGEDAANRSKLDAVIACYLSLTGVAGLQEITQRFFIPNEVKLPLRISAIDALAFHLKNVGAIPRQAIFDSLHQMLHHPDVADYVIGELIDFEDWSAVDEVATLFRGNDVRWLRVAIAKYLLACSKDNAKTVIAQLREIDPVAFQQAETGIVVLPAESTGSGKTSLLANRLLASWLTAPWLLASIAGVLITMMILLVIRTISRRSLRRP